MIIKKIFFILILTAIISLPYKAQAKKPFCIHLPDGVILCM